VDEDVSRKRHSYRDEKIWEAKICENRRKLAKVGRVSSGKPREII
jgi:hypothetical protein